MIKKLFWNDDQQRMRAFWRVCVFLIIAAVIVNPLIMVLGIDDDAVMGKVAVNLLVAISFLASLLVCARFIDRRPLRDFGLGLSRGWLKDFGIGAAIGVIVVTLAVLLGLSLRSISIDGLLWNSIPALPFVLAFGSQVLRYLGGSFFEELLSRSYLMRAIAEGSTSSRLGKEKALLISWTITSLLFGGLHLLNPNATLLGALNISILGAAFGLAFVCTGSLALPIGFHFAWNVFQNTVFGMPNSGKESVVSILETSPHGPNLISGGAFGLEGGLLGTLAAVAGGVLVWRWIVFTNQHRHGKVDLAAYSGRTQG